MSKPQILDKSQTTTQNNQIISWGSLSDANSPRESNCVATFHLGVEDIRIEGDMRFLCTTHGKKQFAAYPLRIKRELFNFTIKFTALLFSIGKCVIVGSANASEAKVAANIVRDILRQAGYSATINNFKIQNVVASCCICQDDEELDIQRLSEVFTTPNEPGVFPATVLEVPTQNSRTNAKGQLTKFTILVYRNGNMVYVGHDDIDEIRACHKTIMYPILEQMILKRKGAFSTEFVQEDDEDESYDKDRKEVIKEFVQVDKKKRKVRKIRLPEGFDPSVVQMAYRTENEVASLEQQAASTKTQAVAAAKTLGEKLDLDELEMDSDEEDEDEDEEEDEDDEDDDE